ERAAVFSPPEDVVRDAFGVSSSRKALRAFRTTSAHEDRFFRRVVADHREATRGGKKWACEGNL
ncbi:MAG TPA: hypothetical protein VFJ06_11145, partial [Halococcus sp.]|nr:hypothetical protein [Halococcus sp.]